MNLCTVFLKACHFQGFSFSAECTFVMVVREGRLLMSGVSTSY